MRYERWIAMALAVVTGCQSTRDDIQLILERHEQAVALLPEEKAHRAGTPIDSTPQPKVEDSYLDSELTLAEARALAVRGNPDIQAAAARLELALAQVALARSRYYPNLVMSHSATRTFLTPANRNRLAAASSLQNAGAIPFDTSSPPALVVLLNALRRPFFNTLGDGDTNSFSEHATALSSSLVLFDGFVREAQLLGAKYTQQASRHGFFDARRLVLAAVEAAYFQVQLAREQIRIAMAAEEFAREQFTETQKLEQAGRASVADVDNFRIRALAAQAEVTESEGFFQTGKVVLAELMGVDGSVLPPDLQFSALAEESPEELTPPDENFYLRMGMENRPDLRQMENLVQVEEQNVRAAHGLYQPVVSVSGSWGYNRTSNLAYEVDDQSSAAGIEMRWEIFSGGAREARIRAAESMYSEVGASLRRQQLEVESQIRRSVIDVRNSQEQIGLQRENVETARENRRMIQAAYIAGKETLTRLNEAQRDFITSEANLALARIRLRQAWSDLNAAAAMAIDAPAP